MYLQNNMGQGQSQVFRNTIISQDSSIATPPSYLQVVCENLYSIYIHGFTNLFDYKMV